MAERNAEPSILKTEIDQGEDPVSRTPETDPDPGTVEEPPVDRASETSKQEKPLPSLSEVEKLIPEKTKALMEELFRARLEKVKRIDPGQIK